MTTRIWIGGGNNKASNPKDWSPTGAPQPGDSLLITGSPNAMPPNGTINIAGNDLAGDTLTAGSIPTHSIVTINLSHDATLNLETLVQGIIVIPQSTTINITGDATLTGDTLAAYNTQTINIGHGTLTLDNLSTTGPAVGQSVVINSSGGALKLQGNANEDVNSTIAVNAPVKGTGMFLDGGSLTFSDSVARGITTDLTSGMSFLQVDEPKHFLGLVDLTGGQIDLNGLLQLQTATPSRTTCSKSSLESP
jgi:hypothetical protein